MAMLQRRKPKKRADQIRGDLRQGFDHLKSATITAGEGMASKAGPRVDNALTKVGLRKRPKRRWPWVAGAITLGTAVGVGGALMWRRNCQGTASDEMHGENRASQDRTRDDLQFEKSTLDPSSAHLTGAGVG